MGITLTRRCPRWVSVRCESCDEDSDIAIKICRNTGDAWDDPDVWDDPLPPIYLCGACSECLESVLEMFRTERPLEKAK